MALPSSISTSASTRPRVAAVVGLTLLEVIREQDLPTEILESEDISMTMPRRLGLSDVVERQIHCYRDEARRKGRISDEELADLVRLVIRRPDSEEVFEFTGLMLAGGDGRPDRFKRLLPKAFAFTLARRAVKARLRQLFGRRIGGFAQGPFTLEGRSLIFIRSDPGGDACHLLSGFCRGVLGRRVGTVALQHSMCEARGDSLCRWTVLAEERARDHGAASDMLLRPEPGAG